MKICFVLDEDINRYGGVQYHIISNADWLAENGHDVTILSCQNPSVKNKQHLNPQIQDTKIANSIELKGLNLNGSISTFPGFADKKQITKILSENKFDVINFHYPFSPFVSGSVLKIASNLNKNNITSSKLICTFLIFAEEKRIARTANNILGLYFKRNINLIDKFINISEPTQNYGIKYLGKNSENIPTGFPRVIFSKKQKQEKEKINILFLGRLEDRKGALDFVKAIQQLPKKYIEESVNVKIAGDGPQKKIIEKYCKDNNLNINILGRVSDKEKDILLKETDIAVFPAKYGESFGIVLIESMNYGCGIIAYANPGYLSTLKEYKDRCLVEINDIKGLSERIKYYTDNKEKLYLLGNELKNTFENDYEINKIGRELINLYKS